MSVLRDTRPVLPCSHPCKCRHSHAADIEQTFQGLVLTDQGRSSEGEPKLDECTQPHACQRLFFPGRGWSTWAGIGLPSPQGGGCGFAASRVWLTDQQRSVLVNTALNGNARVLGTLLWNVIQVEEGPQGNRTAASLCTLPEQLEEDERMRRDALLLLLCDAASWSLPGWARDAETSGRGVCVCVCPCAHMHVCVYPH